MSNTVVVRWLRLAAPAEDTRNCAEIEKQTGRTSIPKGDPLYRPKLDRLGNGFACEGVRPPGGSSGTGGTPVATGATPAANVGAAAQSPTPGELGRTGTSASTIALVAAAVVLLGSAIVLGARRRGQNAA